VTSRTRNTESDEVTGITDTEAACMGDRKSITVTSLKLRQFIPSCSQISTSTSRDKRRVQWPSCYKRLCYTGRYATSRYTIWT